LGDIKRAGFTDQSKLQAMLDKAKAIATKQNKENDIRTIVGIIQQFFKKEQDNIK